MSKNEWYPYNNIKLIYDEFFKLRKSGKSFEQVCDLLGVEIKYDSINSAKRIKEKILSQTNHQYSDDFIEDIRNCTDIDSIFLIFKKYSYNLWATVLYISKLVFNDLNVIVRDNSKNLKTAVLCAAFMDLELLRNDNCFKGFSV